MPMLSRKQFHEHPVQMLAPKDGNVTSAGTDRDFAVAVLLALLGVTLSAAALNSGITVPDLSDIAGFLG